MMKNLWGCSVFPSVSPLSPAVSRGISALASFSVCASVGDSWLVGSGFCWVFAGSQRFARCARARRFARMATLQSGARLVVALSCCSSGSLVALAVPGFLPPVWRVV